jgi:1,4-dihydroxy-6-naphthoate synthase
MTPSRTIRLGYSSCPNDTLIFHALASGAIDTGGMRLRVSMADIEELNRKALRGELEMTKVSFHAFALLRDRYTLLSSGAALGRGCGPLVVSARPLTPEDLRLGASRLRIAVPGPLTTAALLIRLYAPEAGDLLPCRFDRIFDLVLDGRADAGVIIHEGRFTFEARGLRKVIDLGEWWESETGLPLPLGGIAAARSLGDARIADASRWMRASVLAGMARPPAAMEYVRSHARELDDAVIASHIDLYVNRFTVELGDEGRRAVDAMLRMIAERGIAPADRGAPPPASPDAAPPQYPG